MDLQTPWPREAYNLSATGKNLDNCWHLNPSFTANWRVCAKLCTRVHANNTTAATMFWALSVALPCSHFRCQIPFLDNSTQIISHIHSSVAIPLFLSRQDTSYKFPNRGSQNGLSPPGRNLRHKTSSDQWSMPHISHSPALLADMVVQVLKDLHDVLHRRNLVGCIKLKTRFTKPVPSTTATGRISRATNSAISLLQCGATGHDSSL